MPRKSNNQIDELVKQFWLADLQESFTTPVIAKITGISISNLIKDRYYNRGIPFRASHGKITYQKISVLNYLESNKHE